MTRTLLLSAAALALAACSGEVTDGGIGSDTDVAEIEARDEALGRTEAEQIAAQDSGDEGGQPLQEGEEVASREGDPRRGDYPEPGQEMTVNPIEPGNEEPGGKDMLLQKEYAAMGVDAPDAQRMPLEQARNEAAGPVAEYQDKLYLSRNGVSLDELGRAPVQAGDETFEIDDVLVSPMGDAVIAYVLESDGVLGVGGGRYMVQADRVRLDRGAEDGGYRATLAGDRADLAEFEDDAMPEDAMFAADLLREPVRVGDDAETGSVADIVLATDGTVHGLAVAYVGQQFLIRPDQLVLAQGDGGYELSLTEAELREMTPYVGVPAYESRK